MEVISFLLLVVTLSYIFIISIKKNYYSYDRYSKCKKVTDLKYTMTESKKNFRINMNVSIDEPIDNKEFILMKAMMQNIELRLKFDMDGTLPIAKFMFYNPDLKMTAVWKTLPIQSLRILIEQNENGLLIKLNDELKATSSIKMHKGLSIGDIVLNPSNHNEVTVNSFSCH